MTEAEWLACEGPNAMLLFLRDRASERKLRLFACACCRRIWDWLGDERSRAAVEIAEDHADGLADDSRLHTARNDASDCELLLGNRLNPDESARAAYWTLLEQEFIGVAELVRIAVSIAAAARRTEPIEAAVSREACWQVRLLRDIIGNPFRPVAIDPAWLTANVLDLARTIYAERAFDRLPILADALMDAGCDDPLILDHCRSSGPHVRGCWVVDLLLGKA